MKNRDYLPIGFLIALLASCSNPFEPEPKYELHGRVFDFKTNKPIVGASVYAQEAKNGVLHNKQTDSLGKYSIGNLKLDTLAIEVFKSGYQSYFDTIYLVRCLELDIGL